MNCLEKGATRMQRKTGKKNLEMQLLPRSSQPTAPGNFHTIVSCSSSS